MALENPIILTLQLDQNSQSFFDAQRQAYFPAERNFLRAHLTLFHHLPPQHYQQLLAGVEAICQEEEVLPLQVSEVKMIGRGVAYKLESERLLHLHHKLQQSWKQWLIPQDKQRLWPHVTVQNKVQAAQAKALHQQLLSGFRPFTASGIGLQLWEYKGGPWEQLQQVNFVS